MINKLLNSYIKEKFIKIIYIIVTRNLKIITGNFESRIKIKNNYF